MVTPATLYQRLPSLRQRDRRVAVVARLHRLPAAERRLPTLVATGSSPATLGADRRPLFAITIVASSRSTAGARAGSPSTGTSSTSASARCSTGLLTGYGALTTAIVVVLGVVALYLSFIGPITLDMTTFTPWMIAVALYVPFLPFATLAWIEADAPGDEDPTLR